MLTRRTFFAFALLPLSASVQAAIEAGRDYRVLDPAQPTDTPGKIEVIEFFSCGCPGCNQFNPGFMSWAAALPKDVALRRVAVGFGRPQWMHLAKAYYALESTGDVAKVDAALFDAIHKERRNLFDERSLGEWLGQHGVDADKFTSAYRSFGVNTRLMHAEQMVRTYRVNEIPALVVDGRFVPMGRSYADTLRIASELLAKVRAEGAARK